MKACLNDRKYLEELVMEWNAMDTNISEWQRSVLHNLRPHSNLKSLTINNYGAGSLPDWVGQHSFSNMTFLRLENCKHCRNLPPLGQLSSLQALFVIGFEEVVKVSREFYGNNSSSVQLFGVLKVLRFEKMLKWEKWSSFVAEIEGGAFPQLEELFINNCPKLTGRLPVNLPSLAKLDIRKCPQLVVSLPRAPSVLELRLLHCKEFLLRGLPTGLQKLKVGGFGPLKSLPRGLVDCNSNLQELTISNCNMLRLPRLPNFSSLETLRLDGCDSFKSFPLDLIPNLFSIKISGCKNLESFTASEHRGRDLLTVRLFINNCPNFASFPRGGVRAPDLTFFWVQSCSSLTSLPEKMDILMPSLKSFYLIDCPEVESLPRGGGFLQIWNLSASRAVTNSLPVGRDGVCRISRLL
jgi:hypothetical protein